MSALLNQDLDVKYETSDELLSKQAEEGGSLQEERVLQEEKEREEVENQIRSREQAENVEQKFYTSEILSDKTANNEGSEDDLSVADILDLVGRGLPSEAELEAFLDKALTSIASNMAKDEIKAKRQFSETLELVQMLESSYVASLQNPATATNKVAENVRVSLEAVKNAQVNNIDQVRINNDVKQQLQGILKDSFKQIQNNFEAVKSKLPEQVQPVQQQQVKETLQQLSKQAEQIKQEYTNLQNPSIKDLSSQLKQVEKVVENTLVQSKDLQTKLQDNLVVREPVEKLVNAQQNTTQQIQNLQADLQKPIQSENNSPLLKVVENQRANLQAEQRLEPKPEIETKLKVLDSIEKVSQVKVKEPENVIRPDPKVFKEPVQDKLPQHQPKFEKEPRIKQPLDPKEKVKPKLESKEDKIIRPDPDLFRGKPPTNPEKIHVCSGGCCKHKEKANPTTDPTKFGEPVGGKPPTQPKGHVHGAGCGCSKPSLAEESSTARSNSSGANWKSPNNETTSTNTKALQDVAAMLRVA